MPGSTGRDARRLLAACLLFAATTAAAQSWIGGSGSAWSTGANWVGGSAPLNNGTAALDFGASGATFTPSADIAWSLGAITFSTTGYSVSGFPLTFPAAGSIAVVGVGNSISNAISIGSALTLDCFADFTLSGDASGTGSLTKKGAGTLTYTGATWPAGLTTVADGTLRVGDGAAGPSSVLAIEIHDTLVFETPFINVNGPISGTGTLTIEASANVSNVSGTNFAHQGQTTVNGIFGGVFGLGSINNNAPLVIGPSGQAYILNGTVGSLSGSGLLNVPGGTLTVGGDNTHTTFTGSLGGLGSLVKTGTGTLTFDTFSWFSLPSTVTIGSGGSLRIGTPTAAPSSVGGFVINGNLVFGGGSINVQGPTVTGTGTLTIDAGVTVTNFSGTDFTHQGQTTVNGIFGGAFGPGSINNNAPLVIGPSGQAFIVNGTVGSLSGSGLLNVPFGTLTVGGDNTTTTFTGSLGGLGSLVKTGTGTLTFDTFSWFSLPSTVTIGSGGSLRIGTPTAAPSSVGGFVINGNLVFGGGSINVQGPTVTGTGTLTIDAGVTVTNFSGTDFTHQGQTTVNGIFGGAFGPGSINNNAPLVIGPSGQAFIVNGTVGSLSGSGLLNVPFGTLTVGGDNTTTTFTGSLGGLGSLVKTGTGTLTFDTFSWFSLPSTVTIGSGGSLRIGTPTAAPSSVGGFVINGNLVFGGGSINVQGPTVTGTGTLTIDAGVTVTNFSGTDFTHQGQTTVNGIFGGAFGPGSINNNAPLVIGPSGQAFIVNGTVGSLSGSGLLNVPFGTLTVGGDNTTTTFTGSLGGSGNLTKVGPGTLTLAGAGGTFTGGVTVVSGTLSVTGTLVGSITVGASGTLRGTGTVGVVSVAPGGTFAPGVGPGIISTGNLTLSGNLGIEVLGASPGTQHDRVSVSGSVTINNATLALSGSYALVAGDQLVLIANDGSDPVTGTFSGLPEGATFTFNGRTLRISYTGGTGNDVVLSVAAYTVTPSAGANGTIAPNTPQSVAHGSTTTFTVTPNTGYTASVGGTCGGNLVGNTYTTQAVTADCTVIASFTLNTYTVTPSAGPNGAIAPNTAQTVAHGSTTAFTVTPNSGYTASVGGTCGGNLVGNTYTTQAITASCTVIASFTLSTYTVTPSAGPNGSVAPATPQTVAHGSTTSFTITPNTNFAVSVGGTCGGTLTGNTYTTNPITANCTVAVTFELINPPRLVNISTRMPVLTGDDVLIGGFVIGGPTNKTVAIVAAGPSLAAFGITNPLANPTLLVVRSSDSTVVATNDNWQTASNASQLQAAGFAPSDPLEAAVLVNLAPGAYTAIVQGVGGGTGVGLIAVYEVDAVTTPLINISTRGRVQTGNDVMIGGFIIQGQGPQTVAIVATGPSLAAYGIANPLANPTLTLVRSSDQAIIATNDNWQADPAFPQLQAAGLAPSNQLESAIFITLQPGAYTAIVSGAGNITGVGVIGVYKVN